MKLTGKAVGGPLDGKNIEVEHPAWPQIEPDQAEASFDYDGVAYRWDRETGTWVPDASPPPSWPSDDDPLRRVKERIAQEIRPRLERDYNCCGCSTYEQIVADIERIIDEENLSH